MLRVLLPSAFMLAAATLLAGCGDNEPGVVGEDVGREGDGGRAVESDGGELGGEWPAGCGRGGRHRLGGSGRRRGEQGDQALTLPVQVAGLGGLGVRVPLGGGAGELVEVPEDALRERAQLAHRDGVAVGVVDEPLPADARAQPDRVEQDGTGHAQ